MTTQLPLVVMHDDQLLDDVLRVAASVDCEVECAPDVASSKGHGKHPPVVILDEAALPSCGSRELPRGASVLLVCRHEPAAQAWQQAFRSGVEHVLVLPAEESALVAHLADVVDGPGSRDGRMIAVLGARGGAGASVFAASAAVVHARTGGDALLVDCDALGGGIDLVLGAEFASGVRWPDLSLSSGRMSMHSLRAALPRLDCGDGRLSVLSCARDGLGPDADGLAAVVDAGTRSGYTVVCDLSRQLTACGEQAAEMADLVCVVVPAEVRACAAARKLTEQLALRTDRCGVVVRGPAPDALSPETAADAVGVPLLASMRAEPKLGAALERGEFRPRRSGPLAGACHAVLAEATAWSTYEVRAGAA